MSLEENLGALHLSTAKRYRPYYFSQFENDVQLIFDETSRTKNVALFKVNIVKGNICWGADYFIPFKSADAIELNCEELLQKLKTIPCVLDVEVDTRHNLTFCVKRDMFYKEVLQEVLDYGNEYGMVRKNKCVLVLTTEEKSKSFDNLRNSLLAEHIISILAASGTKVFYNKFAYEEKSILASSTKLVCSDNCSVADAYEELEQKIHASNWRTDTDVSDGICMDAKKYIEDNCLKSTYGNAVNSIIVLSDNTYSDLHRTAFVKHLIDQHMNCRPDVIIHIASQGKNRNTFKSGILLEMLENYDSKHVYIFNQSVQYKGGTSTTPDEFSDATREEIVKATAVKYETYVAENEMWKSRIKSLIDAAIKFDFLKMNHSSILNLRPPSSRDGEKNFGIFVQYNFARLSNIFRNFDLKVNEGYYNSLKNVEDVNFQLLTLEEEWEMFNYVVLFPKMVQSIVESLLVCEESKDESSKIRYRLNKVCLMLQELCQLLSLYYSKIRILAGPQPCLQGVMNARLWLLRGIYAVFKNSFILLNIEGLDQM